MHFCLLKSLGGISTLANFCRSFFGSCTIKEKIGFLCFKSVSWARCWPHHAFHIALKIIKIKCNLGKWKIDYLQSAELKQFKMKCFQIEYIEKMLSYILHYFSFFLHTVHFQGSDRATSQSSLVVFAASTDFTWGVLIRNMAGGKFFQHREEQFFWSLSLMSSLKNSS